MIREMIREVNLYNAALAVPHSVDQEKRARKEVVQRLGQRDGQVGAKCGEVASARRRGEGGDEVIKGQHCAKG